ncbi:glutamic acid-rich protein [Phymastichus coffea]|uniref:glutamic acid-rich protein n=1 Tax=Phymastichus coffea TaxID=108790 RepID=UPI00273C2F8D|nr:glutamic acid-rich protein [Phymastichus coffea]XP_058810368.1 glutamic acid-rich protein [Phymastichus coffea]
MSGDVQPRKRKDKRRRRDEDEAALPISSGRSGSTDQLENVAIHIHKESGTGGHWCAKIIFFALLAALLAGVVLIIVEHRGSADVDKPVRASQWTIFEGWVDDTIATHEEDVDSHHLADQSHECEDHEQDDQADEQEQEDEDHTSLEHQLDDDENRLAEEEGEEEEHDEEEEDEEEEADEEREDGQEGEDQPEQALEEEYNQGPAGIDEIDDYNEDMNADTDTDIDDGYFKTRDQSNYELEAQQDKTISEEDVEEDQSKEEEDDDYDLERPFDYASTEKENKYYAAYDNDLSALDEIEDNPDDDENDVNDPYDIDLDVSIEGIVLTKDANADEDTDFVNTSHVNEIDDPSAEPLEEISDDEPEEIINEDNLDDKEEEQETNNESELEEESASVAMKFGVGVALIVTAHFVLVRRWNHGEADNPEILIAKDEVPDLTRRNTIVTPSRINEDGQEPLDEEQEKTYKELHSTYKKVGSSDKKRSGIEEIFAKKTSDLELILRGTTKDKTNDPKEGAREDSDSVEDNSDENYEDEETEDDDVEDVDVNLLEKLDKKYGKLPTSSYDDDEYEDNEADEIEGEDEENELEEDELEEDEEEEEEGVEDEEEEEIEEERQEEDLSLEKYTGSSVKQATNQKRLWTNPSKSKSKGKQFYGLIGDPNDVHVEESITRF